MPATSQRIMLTLLTLLLAAAAAVAATRCASDLDCSLNGVCAAGAGTCACDAGWSGADCGVLDVRPAVRGSGYNLTGRGTSSWGGRVVRDPADAGLHHLFVAEFTGGCGLDSWSPMSRIVRAESRTGSAGPYAFAAEVAGTFAHNPTVVWSAREGRFLMYHIGCPIPQPHKCGAQPLACDGGNDENGESGITLRTSVDLRAWALVGQVLRNASAGAWDADTTNPSPWVDPADGAVTLFYRGCPLNCRDSGNTELLSFATAPAAAGPYARAPRAAPILSAPAAEDPFVWRDARGNWHVLFHSLEPGGGWGGGPKVGRHAFAQQLDGQWHLGAAALAFNTSVVFTDGSRTDFFRRERPQLLLSDDGRATPLLLITGVQEVGSSASYTLIQPLGGA